MLSNENVVLTSGTQWQLIDFNTVVAGTLDFSIQNVSEGSLVEYSFTSPPSGNAGVTFSGSLLPYCGVVTNLTQDVYVRCKDPKRTSNLVVVRNS